MTELTSDLISKSAVLAKLKEYQEAWDDKSINGSSMSMVIAAIEAITNPTVETGPWNVHVSEKADSILLYTLKEVRDGRWRTQEVNDLMIRIENANHSTHDLRPIADKVLDGLNATEKETTYTLTWIAAARPPIHLENMTGRMRFPSFEEAIDFMLSRPSDSEFVSLVKTSGMVVDYTKEAMKVLNITEMEEE